jgi:hypothetical protein
MQVNRQEFLQQLVAVSAGLSQQEVIEQSSCFVFDKGLVITYNDEVSCRQPTSLEFTGAVQARPLLSILQKLADESLEIIPSSEELLLHGKRSRVGIRMEKQITMPIHNVGSFGKWLSLPENFADAIKLVSNCVGKEETQFWSTCVHLDSRWVEACDNFQLSRYHVSLAVKEKSVLVKGKAISSLVDLNMCEFSEKESWMHFRNKDGLVFSCRRYIEMFPELDKLLKVTGTPTVLPKGLSDAIDKAEIFSGENADSNQVLIELSPGKLRIKGIGVSGWYSETKKIKYSGDTMSFMIAPKLLGELCRRYHECEITKDRLKVSDGKFVYVASLEKVKEKVE